MSDPTHVIKLNVPVYAYIGKDGVTQVVIWDHAAEPATVHRYDPAPRADDAGAQVGAEEAAAVVAAYVADENAPGWDFGC